MSVMGIFQQQSHDAIVQLVPFHSSGFHFPSFLCNTWNVPLPHNPGHPWLTHSTATVRCRLNPTADNVPPPLEMESTFLR